MKAPPIDRKIAGRLEFDPTDNTVFLTEKYGIDLIQV